MASRKFTFTHHQFQDLTGKTFGRLTFVRPLGGNRWIVQCSCGKEKAVHAGNVKSGKTTSCGCRWREYTEAKRGTGPSREFRREYFTLKNMLRRCAATEGFEYKAYKAKGIKVCERWANSLENFVADMGRHPGPGYSIERIDNSKGYEPGNCKWATMQEQARNRAGTTLLTFHGETLTASEWAKRIGIRHGSFMKRVAHWGLERAITTPPGTWVRKHDSPHLSDNSLGRSDPPHGHMEGAGR